MEESKLAVLLPQDEEELLTGREAVETVTFSTRRSLASSFTGNDRTDMYRVTELYDLGEEEPPADFGHLQGANNGGR